MNFVLFGDHAEMIPMVARWAELVSRLNGRREATVKPTRK
jgi:hypothetical protein